MGNFGIWFKTHGYHQTHREMVSIEDKAKAVRSGFMRIGPEGQAAGTMAARGLGVMRAGLSGAMSVLRPFISLTMMATKIVTGLGAAVSAVGVALVTKFSSGMMKTRELFYLLETALTGVLKSEAAVRRVSDWAMEYAAKYPAMYNDIMEAMKGMAMMPALKPMFLKGATEEMEKLMNIVSGLAAIDPAQGIKGALFALREALSGQWRSLALRFEIRPEDIGAAAGLSLDELKKHPELAIKALDAYVKLNVGADTLRKTAESLGVQFGNINMQYGIWLNKVAQFGPYQKLVGFLKEVNVWFKKILETGEAEQFGRNVARLYMGAIEGLRTLFTKGVDIDEKSFLSNLKQIFTNVKKAFSDAWAEVAQLTQDSFQLILGYVADAFTWFAFNVMVPIGVKLAGGLFGGFKQYMREHPIATWVTSMVVGGVAGGKVGALGAGGLSAIFLAKEQIEEWIKRPEEKEITIKLKERETMQKRLEELKKELAELPEETKKPPSRYTVYSVVGTQLMELAKRKTWLEREIASLEATLGETITREDLKVRVLGELERLGGELSAKLPKIEILKTALEKPGEMPAPVPVVSEEDKRKLEGLEQMRQKLTDRIKSLTLEQFEYQKWALDQETGALQKKYANDQEMLDLIAQYKKAKLAEIRQAHQEHLDQEAQAEVKQFEERQRKREEFYRAWLERHGAALDGIKAGFESIAAKAQTTFQRWERAAIAAADGMRNALSDLFFDATMWRFKKWYDYVLSLLGSIARVMSDMFASRIVDWGAAMLGGLPALKMPSPIILEVGTRHRGGVVGLGLTPTRVVHETVFAGARRAHLGLGPGERPIIAKEDEWIFTPEQMKALGRGQQEVLRSGKAQAGPEAGAVSMVNVNINAIDPQSFFDVCKRNPAAIIRPIEEALRNNQPLRYTIMGLAR